MLISSVLRGSCNRGEEGGGRHRVEGREGRSEPVLSVCGGIDLEQTGFPGELEHVVEKEGKTHGCGCRALYAAKFTIWEAAECG